MPNISMAQRILHNRKPFVFFHTWTVTRTLLQQAIDEQQSMDLDLCVDAHGKPYLGHSQEYHEKSGEPYFDSMPLDEAIRMLSASSIPVMVDVKHYDAWPVVARVVETLGPHRCLVCTYVEELKFDYTRTAGEQDYLTEWSPIERLRELKKRFPAVTITPCAKWLPDDLLTSSKHVSLLGKLKRILKSHHADTVCLGVPDRTISDGTLRYFLTDGIIPHVMIDYADASTLTELYIGETDHLEKATSTL